MIDLFLAEQGRRWRVREARAVLTRSIIPVRPRVSGDPVLWRQSTGYPLAFIVAKAGTDDYNFVAEWSEAQSAE